MTQEPREGQDGLDNQAFLGSQEDKEDKVIFSGDMDERSDTLQVNE